MARCPSRRAEIVLGATTAFYYHFGGKEEPFDQAFAACLADILVPVMMGTEQPAPA